MLLSKYRKNRVLNEEVKYRHDECQGNTGNLYVRYGRKKGQLGWHYHCHSCCNLPEGLSGFHSTEQLTSPSETLQQLADLLESKHEIVLTDNIYLPDDITYQLPQIAMKYMLKYDLSEEEIVLSRFGWSPSLERMIMPVYKDGVLIYWQGRNLGEITETNPKYKNVYLRGSRDVFSMFSCCAGDCSDNGRTIVLVEAIISAVKLSRHVDTIALLGSYIPASILHELKGYDTVIIWLDPDKKAAILTESVRWQMLTGKPVKAMLTDKKPKQYNDKELLWYLK